MSTGDDNDDLIDNLLAADYIKTPLIEKVFRAVDRAHYYLPDHKDNAYKDLAWKHGHLHLSAPCIYSEVMESLELESGHSFLNLGSGTGYLSTMVGLIVGPYGINHGVEIHADVVEYAQGRVEEYRKTADSFDEYEFCDPEFVLGNCLLVTSGCHLYDRVYCGAACPPEHENYMKNLIKVGGILVMPLNDQLQQIKRTTETSWETKNVLPVSFASLIIPSTETGMDMVELPELHLPTLQESCRLHIRRILRDIIKSEHPDVRRKRVRKPKRKRVRQRRINLVPMNAGMMVLNQFYDSDGDMEREEDGEDEEDAPLMDSGSCDNCGSKLDTTDIDEEEEQEEEEEVEGDGNRAKSKNTDDDMDHEITFGKTVNSQCKADTDSDICVDKVTNNNGVHEKSEEKADDNGAALKEPEENPDDSGVDIEQFFAEPSPNGIERNKPVQGQSSNGIERNKPQAGQSPSCHEEEVTEISAMNGKGDADTLSKCSTSNGKVTNGAKSTSSNGATSRIHINYSSTTVAERLGRRTRAARQSSESSDEDDDYDDDRDDFNIDPLEFDIAEMLRRSAMAICASPPRKVRCSSSTSADTETSGICTMSDHSDVDSRGKPSPDSNSSSNNVTTKDDSDIDTDGAAKESFKLYMKQKVDVLPIPHAMKAYLMHYRE